MQTAALQPEPEHPQVTGVFLQQNHHDDRFEVCVLVSSLSNSPNTNHNRAEISPTCTNISPKHEWRDGGDSDANENPPRISDIDIGLPSAPLQSSIRIHSKPFQQSSFQAENGINGLQLWYDIQADTPDTRLTWCIASYVSMTVFSFASIISSLLKMMTSTLKHMMVWAEHCKHLKVGLKWKKNQNAYTENNYCFTARRASWLGGGLCSRRAFYFDIQ